MSDTPKLIHQLLEVSADRVPNKTAIVDADDRITYKELDRMVNRLAHYLVEIGVTAGDRGIILLPNSEAYVVCYYALLKCGGVAVPLSTDQKPEGLRTLLSEIDAKIIISSHRHERLLKTINPAKFGTDQLLLVDPKIAWTDTTIRVQKWQDIVYHGDYSRLEYDLQTTALGSIIYTSGSAGEPKGVMLSHANILANTMSICRYLNISSDDRQLVVLPFFYVMGKSLLNTHIASGATVVINNQSAFPATVVKQMVEEKITAFSGVPSTYAYLLHRSPLAAYREKLPHLRYCSQAGGHMAHPVKMALREVLPAHTDIIIMYGATEASARMAYLAPNQLVQKVNSIGKAIPGSKLCIVNPSGQTLPPGAIGEIVGQGANIMMGYWKNSRATAKALSPLGYHTGDMGYYDDNGYFYLIGRRDNLIKVSGHRINIQEVEDAVIGTGLVMDAAVIGIPDTLLGNRMVALAIAKDNSTLATEILEKCSESLPHYKLPSEIKLMRALPLKANGKIDRHRCITLAMGKHDA